jgi:hypothetical protein
MQRLRAPCATCLFGSGRCWCCGGCRSCWCSSLGFLVLGLLGCALGFACFVLGLHFLMLGLFGLGIGLVFGVLLFRGFRCLCGSGCCRGGRCCGGRSRCLGKSAKRGDNQSSSDQRLFQHIQFPCMANLPWVLNPPGLRAVYRRCVNLCKATWSAPQAKRLRFVYTATHTGGFVCAQDGVWLDWLSLWPLLPCLPENSSQRRPRLNWQYLRYRVRRPHRQAQPLSKAALSKSM